MGEQHTVERVQLGVRMEKTMVKVLKGIAQFNGETLGELLEKIVLHSFDPVPGMRVNRVPARTARRHWPRSGICAAFMAWTTTCTPLACSPRMRRRQTPRPRRLAPPELCSSRGQELRPASPSASSGSMWCRWSRRRNRSTSAAKRSVSGGPPPSATWAFVLGSASSCSTYWRTRFRSAP